MISPSPPLKFVELTNVLKENLERKSTKYAHFYKKNFIYLGSFNGKINSQIIHDNYESSPALSFEKDERLSIDDSLLLYKVTDLPDYNVMTFNSTDKRIICVFWKDKFCKLANVDSKNVLSLQCNDGIYHIGLDGSVMGGRKMHKKQTIKRNKNARTLKKSKKHRHSRKHSNKHIK